MKKAFHHYVLKNKYTYPLYFNLINITKNLLTKKKCERNSTTCVITEQIPLDILPADFQLICPVIRNSM